MEKILCCLEKTVKTSMLPKYAFFIDEMPQEDRRPQVSQELQETELRIRIGDGGFLQRLVKHDVSEEARQQRPDPESFQAVRTGRRKKESGKAADHGQGDQDQGHIQEDAAQRIEQDELRRGKQDGGPGCDGTAAFAPAGLIVCLQAPCRIRPALSQPLEPGLQDG